MRRLSLCLLAACSSSPSPTPDAAQTPPTANADREVIDTGLVIDYAGMTGIATVTLGPSTSPGASLEAEGLSLGRAASDQPTPVVISYHWMDHEGFTGASAKGYTLDWPYYCGNIFPCHSQPSDGTTFSLELDNTPAGAQAIYPATSPAQAPAYQLAWASDSYTQLDLGTTPAGTLISVWYRPGEMAAAMTGTQHLVAAFDWLESTLGPYRFGLFFGAGSVKWGPGQFGGMEHHPFVPIGSIAIGDEDTNVHESAHGWFGDGIRLQCWEDFVLSEGTVSYLAGRALDVVAPTVGATVWMNYTNQLAAVKATDPVWPQSCGAVDGVKDHLFTEAPYMRGAFFYRGIAEKVGAAQLDQVLAAFYAARAGGSARMADMLALIQQLTGYDPTACAKTWLLDPVLL